MATYIRYNSSVKYKSGNCLDCPPEKGEQPLIAGRCQYHYAIKLKMKSRDKILERDAEKKEDLEIWYNQRSAQILMKPYCMEPGCGVWIPPQYYRHATSHILKKSLFPSVATHPMNFLILAASCGHHGQWDSDWESAQKLGIWEEGLRRFKIFSSLIAKEEFKNLPDVLRKEIE